ncbi:type 1 fimbrial protein [Cupriavidus necator]|uniref:Type 1 fimbrial protein n=1 Tax=Cupriavidus necator TaxID=106590 RepID=A0A1U9V1N7_CUPNE|nr:fimbrial protein [Cupriavidus necator]AQV98719.1 type 1 fimbrial protein [Cupriavidus necator]
MYFPKFERWSALLKASAGIFFLALSGHALADLSCNPMTAGTQTFTLPSGTYGIPRDTPVGTRITPFTGQEQKATNTWTCMGGATYIGPVYKSLLVPSGMTYTEGSLTYTVYNTNVAGVGLIMSGNSYLVGGWRGGGTNLAGIGVDWAHAGMILNLGSMGGFGPSIGFAFVKTGPIAAGTVSLAGTVAQIGMAQLSGSAYINLQQVVPAVVTGNPVFNELACTTPNVTVNMGTHKNSEFTGAGSFTSSTGFSIALNNCPAGINLVKYQVDAATTILNPSNSVVALDSASTAAGVGVQLLDDTGSVVPLGTAKTLSGYSTGTGGSYTIPLKARYYQTGATVTAGTANSAMTFTMTYQ